MIQINWLQPYTTDKNIGREFNRMISLLPADEWVGLTDHDAMFLRPDSKAQIADVVSKHGNQYDVFGVLTNRLYGAHQRFEGVFSSGGSIDVHMAIANHCHNVCYGQIKETQINIAGLCMVFNKRTWDRVGGFREHSICLDKEFTGAVMATGGRLAVLQGVYVFHLYRWGQENPGQYVEHLL